MIQCLCWLVFMAVDPASGKTKFFVDKCLPFGTSISCTHYQCFSNSLRHIMEYKTKSHNITNYLDDLLCAAWSRILCNTMIRKFLDLCEHLSIPVALEKTQWVDTVIVFLGILLDGHHLVLCVPLDKRDKALKLLNDLSGKRKATIKQL